MFINKEMDKEDVIHTSIDIHIYVYLYAIEYYSAIKIILKCIFSNMEALGIISLS